MQNGFIAQKLPYSNDLCPICFPQSIKIHMTPHNVVLLGKIGGK